MHPLILQYAYGFLSTRRILKREHGAVVFHYMYMCIYNGITLGTNKSNICEMNIMFNLIQLPKLFPLDEVQTRVCSAK